MPLSAGSTPLSVREAAGWLRVSGHQHVAGGVGDHDGRGGTDGDDDYDDADDDDYDDADTGA